MELQRVAAAAARELSRKRIAEGADAMLSRDYLDWGLREITCESAVLVESKPGVNSGGSDL
jgi:hypothetical protein